MHFGTAMRSGDGCPYALRSLRCFSVLVRYKSHSHWFVLLFAVSCALGSVYGFVQGAWPFGLVEAAWGALAVRRWLMVQKSSFRTSLMGVFAVIVVCQCLYDAAITYATVTASVDHPLQLCAESDKMADAPVNFDHVSASDAVGLRT